MPASEEEITDHKKNFLKEMFGNMISSHVDGHKSKNSLQSIQFDQNRILTDTDSKVSIRVLDNRQNYQDVDKEWVKSGFENSSKRISKMGQQNPNDIMNIKIQKELRSSEINKFSYRTMHEKNMLSCSRSDDDITFVKEAYIYQGITGVDGTRHENSVSSSNIDCQDEELNKETASDVPKTLQVQERIDIQEQRRCDSVQERKKDRDTLVHVVNGDGDGEAKYMTDIMESEKNNSIDEHSKVLDAESVEEKHDVERAEKGQEIAYAEHQNCMQMLYCEFLSEFTALPQLISSSFLSMTGSVLMEQKMLKNPPLIDSLESAASCKESRCSLEWPDSSNYPRNIFASRQTNISSFLISDEIFSQTADLRRQHESILFHADKKTCNISLFSNSIDWNVFKISISQKCESKDVFEMEHWNHGRFQDSESRCSYQNVLENGCIDGHDCHIDMSSIGSNMFKVFASDFEECRDPEDLKKNKDLEIEEVDAYYEDPIEQNYSLEQLSDYDLCDNIWYSEGFFDKPTNDSFCKVEGGESENDFSMQTDDGVWKVESDDSFSKQTDDGVWKVESDDSFSKQTDDGVWKVESDDSFNKQTDGGVWKVESVETDDSFKKQTDEDFWEMESVDTDYLFDSLGRKTEKNFRKTEYPENNSDYFQEDDEADFGELKDLEHMHELSGEEEDNMDVKDGNKSSYSKKNKFQKLKRPVFRKSKRKKHWTHSNDSKWGSVFLARRWSFNNKKTRGFDIKSSRRKENEATKHRLYPGKQENSGKKYHLKNKFFQPLLSVVKNTSTRKQNDGHRRNINCKQEFSRKSRNKMPKLFQYKINKGKKQGTKTEERKGKKYEWEKPTKTRKLGSRLRQYFQKPIAFMKWQHNWQMRLFKGCNLYLSGNHPIRLHLVEAGVYTRSGNGKKNGNYSNSGSGSTNGNQGDGNNSAQRGNGSGRHSGSGSGSGGSGNSNNNNNNNNNNNDDHNKNSAEQKSSSVHKRSKDKKADKKTDSHDTRPYSPDNQNSLPSLPPPILDNRHIAERCSVEDQWKARHGYDETSEMLPPRIALASSQQDGAHDLPDGVFDAQNSLGEEEEEVIFQHAAISIEQLCDIIGNSTRSFPSGSDNFGIFNICFTRIAHNLSLAADDNDGASFDSCSVCLVLSQLLIHMADPGHDGCVSSCEQCSQIFNLIMEHCIGCIAKGRPKSRITQSDLCYKICKYSQWNIEQLCQSSNKLKGKVQKYCDKVLGNTLDMVSTRASKGIDPEGIGEIGEAVFTDVPSTEVSSTTTLSFGGNIVTAETGEQDQRTTHAEHLHQFVNLSAINSTGALSVGNSSAAVGNTGVDSDGHSSHSKLVRKPSHPRKTPAIPQPIPEDSQPESNTMSPDGDDGRGDDTERIIYRRMMKTYGNQYRYGSLQEGNVHDVEQFLSETNQPLGAPGIGEVVFAHPHQLKIVAGFWDRKREECERTQTCPYQHREEGVILAEYKEYFGILLTRYQKHHQWERVSHLGNGMSGKCHLAIDLKTNFKFCCKKIHLLRYTEEELTLWSEMKNPYVVKLYGAIRHGVKIYIFSEFIDGGSLAACIEEQKYLGRRLSHWSAINYFQQLLKVLAFLQKKNILHEDIKADNILLRRNSIYLAVTDFGTSRRLQDPKELKNKSPVGSPTHWSPEKASMEGHGFPSDLWAAVCVLVHMLSGEPPWVKRFMHKAAILNFIIFHRPPPMEDVPDNIQLVVRDLITKGFVKDPQARPSSGELLQHPAFKILDEGTPETYFSTLTSMAHGFPVIQAAVGGAEQQSVRKDMSSTAQSTAADATVLYAGKVSTGPYQESDSRPGNMNKQPSERIAEVINPNENVRTVGQQQNEGDRNGTNVIDQSKIDKDVREEGLAASVETQNEQLQNVPNIANPVATESQVSVAGSNVDSKVRQLVGPLDIDSLLPQFNELFVSGDSASTQSIKSFFADAYNTEEFNGAKPSPLEMYKPEVKQDVLPNLSIFDWEAPVTRQQDGVSESEHFISNLSQISALPGVTNPPIRGRLQGRPANSQNTINFMLSSESDECTSADLFDPEPAARTSDSGQYGSNISDIHAETNGSETQRPSMNPLEDMSPTASTSGSSNTSTLQMRKPTNLTLHCTPLPPELPHSRSDIPLLSAQSVNESEMKHRSNTWSQLSTTHNPQHTGSTPNSSQVTSALKKTNGTSVPSTASSGHSQFSYHRSSVKEEQEKRIQELTNMLSAYSTSSDSDTSFFYHQQEIKYTDVPELEDKPDIDTVFKTMLEEMDETKLGGHNLKFFNDGNSHLFTMHIEELPANWRHFISSFRQKITHCGYNHFSVNHMNNKPVKYHHPLGAHEFKVIRLQVSGEQCWCYRCKPMYG